MSDTETECSYRRMRSQLLSVRRHLHLVVVAAATIIVSACMPPSNALNPKGPVAFGISNMFWLMFAISVVVFAIVVGFLVYGLYRRPSDSERGKGLHLSRTTWFGIVSTGLTSVVLVGMMVLDISGNKDLSVPSKPLAFTFQVIGHQYWWEVHYSDPEAVTANEIHIPVGEAVLVEASTFDVIHSFWIPQLQGKVDMIPGHTNPMWLQADVAGIYRGQCAEYAGELAACCQVVSS